MTHADDPDIPEDEIDPDLFAAIADQVTVSAVQPPSRRELAKRAREYRERREFWTHVLATEVGRREVWRILMEGHPFETRYGVGPNGFPQPEASWFNRGAQDLALRVFFTLQCIDPQGIFLMQNEHDPRFAERRPRQRKRAE